MLFMQNGMTPLHLAVWHSIRSDNHATVKTLLEYNADCSAEDDVIFIIFSQCILLCLIYLTD